MRAATWPRERPELERLLHVDPCGERVRDATVGELPSLLRAGDLLVVNDAATLPASLAGRAQAQEIELRLAAAPDGHGRAPAVLLGAGDWRTRTEDRPPPPRLAAGARLDFGPRLSATVLARSPISPRLCDIAFDATGDALWRALYAVGRPVQYAHVAAPLSLYHVQTAFAARPWAVEEPSAGRPITVDTLLRLRARGVRLASLTHAAGLSATGDPALDDALPLPERYDIPPATAAAVHDTLARGGRVVAAGTTVVRALEGAARHPGGLAAGAGVTDLKIGPGFHPRVASGLLTGLHEPGTSHMRLIAAFAPPALVDRAWAHAGAAGYLGHEFGDASLLLCA